MLLLQRIPVRKVFSKLIDWTIQKFLHWTFSLQHQPRQLSFLDSSNLFRLYLLRLPASDGRSLVATFTVSCVDWLSWAASTGVGILTWLGFGVAECFFGFDWGRGFSVFLLFVAMTASHDVFFEVTHLTAIYYNQNIIFRGLPFLKFIFAFKYSCLNIYHYLCFFTSFR